MFPSYYLMQCTSTNDAIRNYLLNAPAPLCLYTYNQTQGRGQYGNSWTTMENQNLAFSLALPTALWNLDENLLNYHTAETLRRFIVKLTRMPTFVKWPNDLILHRKKIAGMLIEKAKVGSEWFYILGFGLNVNQDLMPNLPSSGSLWTQSGSKYPLDSLTQALNEFLFEELLKPQSEVQILDAFNHHLFRRGEVAVFECQGVRQNGIIQRADSKGLLHVELESEGLKSFYHKEIKMLY